MKKVLYAVAIFATIGLTSGFSQNHENHTMDKSEQTAMTMATFGVRGNCGMCKKTIEKAAHSVEGVSKATWNKKTKKMMVSFDASKTTEMAIHKAIAASGYDTEKVKGSETTYNNLPGCCKYDHEMKMNQTSEVNKEHSSHNH